MMPSGHLVRIQKLLRSTDAYQCAQIWDIHTSRTTDVYGPHICLVEPMQILRFQSFRHECVRICTLCLDLCIFVCVCSIATEEYLYQGIKICLWQGFHF